MRIARVNKTWEAKVDYFNVENKTKVQVYYHEDQGKGTHEILTWTNFR